MSHSALSNRRAGGLIDDAGHAAYAYGQDALILVRPDGYIGLIADADNALAATDYLRWPGQASRLRKRMNPPASATSA